MPRKVKEPEPQPVGEAEAKRLQRRAAAATKLKDAEAELEQAQQALAQATEGMLAQGPSGDTTVRDEARRRVEDLELFVQHYRTAVAVYDGEQPCALCEQWDTRQSPVDAYLAELEQLRPEVERVAAELVALMVRARGAHAGYSQAANDSAELVHELAGYGIQVRESRPNLVSAQSTIALALRKALTAAGLSPHEHFPKECLAPKNYTPPEAFAKADAA